MTASRPLRYLLGGGLLAAAALTLLLAACGGKSPGPSADPSSQPSGEGLLDTSTGSPTTAAPPPAQYPDTARAYAEAVLAAWDGDVDRLGDLSTPEVQEQLMEVPMPLNMTWHFKHCVNVSPNWDCVFFNDNGDRQSVAIQDSLLGHAHGAVAVALAMTEFPTVAVTYGRAFADAWRDGNLYRMRRLADDAVANSLYQDTAPGNGYRACGDGAAGSTYVRIYGGGGPEYVLRVSNPALGHPDAVQASVPPPNPPACQQVIINPSIPINPTIFQP